MKEAGYQFVNIDDCWHGTRDAQGFIQPNAERFPSGMKALADYVHSKGLKLGIYSDAGAKTCGGKPGSRGREYQDAQTYAQWGIDYLKYDWCNAEDLNARGAYSTMRDALYATGRPIVFSLCEWGKTSPGSGRRTSAISGGRPAIFTIASIASMTTAAIRTQVYCKPSTSRSRCANTRTGPLE